MAATHLIHHTSGYIFRYCIPPDIQPNIKRKELRYSLRTGSLRSAKARGRMLASYVSAVIADIRVGGSLAKLNADQINLRFKEMLDAAIGQPSSKPSPIDQSQKAQVLETLPSMRYGAANKAKSKRKPRSLKLSEVLKRYCQEAKVAGKWSDLSAIEIPRGIKFFIRVHGDRPIDTPLWQDSCRMN